MEENDARRYSFPVSKKNEYPTASLSPNEGAFRERRKIYGRGIEPRNKGETIPPPQKGEKNPRYCIGRKKKCSPDIPGDQPAGRERGVERPLERPLPCGPNIKHLFCFVKV
jgi:hypothetical protein